MEKLMISGRTNWEKKIYIKLKAKEKAMQVVKKMVKEMKDNYFEDNQAIPKSLSNYEKWKDQWIPILTKDIGVDIICGDKFIHLMFNKFKNFDFVNLILDKYCEWEKPK